jgi:large subunit ribosomal protein L6
MSRIGKKPIPLPAGVKYTVQGNLIVVEGPNTFRDQAGDEGWIHSRVAR